MCPAPPPPRGKDGAAVVFWKQCSCFWGSSRLGYNLLTPPQLWCRGIEPNKCSLWKIYLRVKFCILNMLVQIRIDAVAFSVVAGAPLAPPPSDATKPKVPSGPDLRVPGPQSLSLGATPQLASAPAKAASKAAGKVMLSTPLQCLCRERSTSGNHRSTSITCCIRINP